MKKNILIGVGIFSSVLIALAIGYKFGNETKQVEMRLFQQGEMTPEVITISDRLFEDMQKCSKNNGVVSIYHSSFESELVCYNGQAFTHEDGEWRSQKETTL